MHSMERVDLFALVDALSLDGTLRPTRGALPIALRAWGVERTRGGTLAQVVRFMEARRKA